MTNCHTNQYIIFWRNMFYVLPMEMLQSCHRFDMFVAWLWNLWTKVHLQFMPIKAFISLLQWILVVIPCVQQRLYAHRTDFFCPTHRLKRIITVKTFKLTIFTHNKVKHALHSMIYLEPRSLFIWYITCTRRLTHHPLKNEHIKNKTVRISKLPAKCNS